LGAVAELERAKIIERVTRGKQLRLSQGQLLGCGVHTFGYDYIRKSPSSPPSRKRASRSASFSCTTPPKTATASVEYIIVSSGLKSFFTEANGDFRRKGSLSQRRSVREFEYGGHPARSAIWKSPAVGRIVESLAGVRMNDELFPRRFTEALRPGSYFQARLQNRTRRHREQAEGLTLSQRPLAGFAQDEEPGLRGT
jgi:hypothetical protein